MVAALVAGAIAALVLLVAFTVVDDPCPDYDDEGPMAAPASPYARIMCATALAVEPAPMSRIEVQGVLLIGFGLAAVSAIVLVRRRPRMTRRRVAGGVVGVLVLQPLVVLALQYGLPRDCLSGRADYGECSRERERR